MVYPVDSTIHSINHYPVDSAIGFPNTYPLDSKLSSGLDVANWGHGWQNLHNLSDPTMKKNIDKRAALKRL